MRRAVWACIGLIVFLAGLGSSGWAVERELVDVRLGERAMGLLDKAGYGQPDYIGPLGTLSVAAAEPTQAGAAAGGAQARPGGAVGAARSGPTGPGTAAGGMGAGGARGGRGGMGAGGARGGRGGMGAARGGAGAAGRAGGQAAARPAATTGAPRAAAPGMYWYYRRPGGAVAVLRLTVDGQVTGITLSGIAPTPGGRTTKGIGLGSHYMDIIASYGYPDQMVSGGTALEMTYVDHGVRFSLDTMRVREIAIGAHVAAEAAVAPATPETAPPPPAGLSIEELRGYL